MRGLAADLLERTREMPEDLERFRAAYEKQVRLLERAVDARTRELAILAEVAARVHGEDEVQTILDIALEEILRRMDLKAAWVFMGDEKDHELHLMASRGVSASYLEDVRNCGLGECLCVEVFESGNRMQARNTTQCPRMPQIVEGLNAAVAHACIPLSLGGERRGVLNVAARYGERFSDDELRFLETLGHQICLAVERARHLESERARNQEARTLAAINKAMGGSLDVAAVMQAVGEAAREVLGAERVQIFLGSDPRSLTVAHLSGLPHPELKEGEILDSVALGARLLRRALEERRPYAIDDWATDERVNQDLARRWGAASGIVVPMMAREKILGLLVLTHTYLSHWREEQLDVAEALAAQASVAIENAGLYEAARRAYIDLKDAQAQMIRAEKMAVLGTFASGLAHEVRNPLNSIALQLSILERRANRLEAGLSAEVAALIGIIRQEIRRLEGLVNDFLLFAGASRVQLRPADLDSLLDEAIRLLRPEARQCKVTLRRQRLPDPIPILRIDVEKMKQVIINLVRNAIEAMPDGGVVVVEAGVADGKARLGVCDTGPGLPTDLEIFNLFVTTKPGGTGLGLSIAQQIVQEHGGELTASSEPGKGATFTVTLPLALAEHPA